MSLRFAPRGSATPVLGGKNWPLALKTPVPQGGCALVDRLRASDRGISARQGSATPPCPARLDRVCTTTPVADRLRAEILVTLGL